MSDDVFLFMPRDIEPPTVDWSGYMSGSLMHQSFGMGIVRPDRMVRIVEPEPMPQAPGVSEMLLDGWQWVSGRFVRDGRGRSELYAKTVVEVQHEITDLDAPVFVASDGRFRSDEDVGAIRVNSLMWCEVSWERGVVMVAAVCTKRPRAPGRYAGHIDARRVLSGRYADRLPTNRARKRERAKARRRERLAAE